MPKQATRGRGESSLPGVRVGSTVASLTEVGAAPRARPRVVQAVIIAGGLLTIVLWWRNTPSIDGFGDWLTNAGRILGLLAGYAIAVLLALMARIPVLERGIGADNLARWHSMGGRYTVSLVVAHALLITWGYAVQAHTNVFSQTSTLLISYPDVLMATVAGGLLLVVGLVSMRAVRHRLRYETWYYLHFYTYLAAALAFSHQFADGAEFITDRPARITWVVMYSSVAAAILWYRFLTPVRQAVRHRLRVESVSVAGPDVISIVIHGRHLSALAAESGQFFRWRFLTRELWWTSMPFSLSAPTRNDRFRITVKAQGDHSRALMSVVPGTRIIAEGPYGAMTAAARRRAKVLLVAGGVGITPLRALLETIPAAPGDVTFIYRAGSDEDIIFRSELETLARQRDARVLFVTGHRSELGTDPLSVEAIRKTVPDLADHDVYICGPPSMTSAVSRSLRGAGVATGQIHQEVFQF